MQAYASSDGQSDLAALWQDAVQKYAQKSKKGRKLIQFEVSRVRNMSDIMTQVDTRQDDFDHFRDRDSKAGKVRSAFSRQLGNMKKCVGCLQAIGSAAAVFPPAMPVSLVFAACNQLLDSFAAVSADYDKVEEFYAFSGRFFDQMTILESEVASGPLARCIVQVFSSMLEACGVAQAMTEDRKGVKSWLHKVWSPEDSEISTCFTAMQGYIEELGRTVNYSSYKEIRETHRETMRTNTKLDQMDDQMFNLSKLMNDQKDMSLVISNQIRAQNEAQSAQFKSLFARLDKQHLRMMAPSNEKKKHEAKSAGKGDLRDKRLTAILRIKKYLNDYFEETHWRDADDESKAIQRDIQDTFVDGTGNWLINGDKVFTAWIDGECPVLWLQGLEGIGKTFLSFAATKKVQELSGHKSVALFGFRENQPSIQKVEVAFACMALQIAQKNNKYAEKLATHLDRMGKSTEDTSLWKHLFTSMFPATSSTDETEDSEEHLYLVFDGIDEADELERKCLFEFLEEISAKKSHVHALLTSRAEMWQHVANTNHSIVNVTRENIANDARTLIARRMKTLPRLRKFSSVVQKRIVKRVHAHTDSMLYIEHCLRRLSSIGREKAVLNELDSLPDSLHALYKLLLDDCKKNRSQQQYEALKKLFAWLAYSKRSLTLLEATALTDMLVAQGDRFDIEDEILGRSSRILELSGDRAVDDDVDAEAQTEAIDNFDDQVEDSEIDGESLAYYSKSVTFQERALRHYFTIVSAEDDEDMRIPPLHAHLDILESSTRIIEQLAESTPSKNVQELGDYAVNHWYQHLMGIDVNKASNEQVWKVVLAIHRVMSASLEKAKAIGQRLSVESFYQRDVDIYFHNWFDDMLQWVKRSHSLLEIAPNSEIRKWVAEVGEDEKAAMNALVRGHSQAWLLSLDESNIVQMFNCAKGALKMQGVDIPEDGTLHSVMLVADHFDDLQDDARAWRVRAATMNELAWEDDIEATEQDWDKIQEFYEKSIALETGNSDINRFQAYFHLAQNAICDDDWEITLQNLDKAHATLLPEHRQEMKKKLIDLALIKTNCLSSMGRAEDALAASNEARLVAGEDLLSGYDLDDLTMAFNEENDKTGHHLMTFLKSWTEKELHNWYDFVFGEDIDEAQFLLFRAAWRSDQIDFVPTTISNYQKKLRPWSTTLFATYIVLAWFYQWVVRDRVKAKELNKVALGLKIKPVDDMDWCQEQISGLLMNRALLIFAEFNESTDPLRKTQLVEELKSIPDNAVGGNNTFDESHVDMVLANMLSIMGPAVTYKEHMDKIFNSCVEGLEDTVSWNDASSLRLFAKVLSAFPSLERDALIALSSQFSILDKEVVDETSEGSDSDSESESESESESPADNAEADSEDAQEKLPELDEDLTNTPIYCNNEDCQFRIKRWSQPFYLCLLCTSCDLCAPCYEKRLVWNRTGTVDSWCSYCDKDHVYMKGPMKDWKGIKDGIIHIGEEKIAFKDWLKEIKEVKWKKAWDEFWIKGYGRRSIGC